MMFRVPSATVDFDHFRRWMSLQILADVNRSEPQRARPMPFQYRSVEESPESTVDLGSSEPASILAIGPGRHQGRKIAKLGSFTDFVLKPAWIKPRQLGVGQLTIPRNDHDFGSLITRQV